MSDSRDPISLSIHKTLALRLGLVAVVVAAAVGAAAYYLERGRILETVLFGAEQRVQLLNARVLHLLDREGDPDRAAIQRELERFAASRTRRRTGRFAVARVFDRRGALVAELADETEERLDSVRERLERWQSEIARARTTVAEFLRLNHGLHIKVAVPLLSDTGSRVGAVAGIFAVSGEAQAEMQTRGIRATLLAVAIVVVTAALLYPVIVSLTGRLTRYSAALLNANLETLRRRWRSSSRGAARTLTPSSWMGSPRLPGRSTNDSRTEMTTDLEPSSRPSPGAIFPEGSSGYHERRRIGGSHRARARGRRARGTSPAGDPARRRPAHPR